MNIQGTSSFDQVAKSVQMLNALNQKIVDEHQEISGKLLNMSVTEKVAALKNAGQSEAINLLA